MEHPSWNRASLLVPRYAFHVPRFTYAERPMHDTIARTQHFYNLTTKHLPSC